MDALLTYFRGLLPLAGMLVGVAVGVTALFGGGMRLFAFQRDRDDVSHDPAIKVVRQKMRAMEALAPQPEPEAVYETAWPEFTATRSEPPIGPPT